MEAVKEFKTKDKVLKIFIDESPESPRTAWDNLGTMVCFHRRYDLGDKHNYSSSDYDSWDEVEKAIIKQEDVAVILPLYLYDHSGITMNTTGFSCGWDSGQVGFIYVSRETLRKEYSVKRISNKIVEKATKLLLGEVETYDQFLKGDVYGFKVFNVETCDKGCEHEEEIDSCWGFFGDNFIENGLIEYVDKEFAELLEK
jgi:hypothetical protein